LRRAGELADRELSTGGGHGKKLREGS
jgi:hypothetical protein